MIVRGSSRISDIEGRGRRTSEAYGLATGVIQTSAPATLQALPSGYVEQMDGHDRMILRFSGEMDEDALVFNTEGSGPECVGQKKPAPAERIDFAGTERLRLNGRRAGRWFPSIQGSRHPNTRRLIDHAPDTRLH